MAEINKQHPLYQEDLQYILKTDGLEEGVGGIIHMIDDLLNTQSVCSCFRQYFQNLLVVTSHKV